MPASLLSLVHGLATAIPDRVVWTGVTLAGILVLAVVAHLVDRKS